MNGAGQSQLQNLQAALKQLDTHSPASGQLQEILAQGFGTLPQPGAGATLQRWQALAAVAAHDLSLVKLFEGHTDALAILAELNLQTEPQPTIQKQSWGVWAAEMPGTRVVVTPLDGAEVLLDGVKCWCSGAQTVSHGLLTAWHADGGGPQLVRVAMQQSGVGVSAEAWAAVGMAESASVDVRFTQARAHLVGRTGAYLSRPGFWQGGAGIAACWYGGALGLGLALQQALHDAPQAARSPFKMAALGKVDLALFSTAQTLRCAAQWIDDNPQADASAAALRVRLAAEQCGKVVLDEAGRALGAAAFCRDARFARAAADLPVFIRQSHAERDFAALADRVIQAGAGPWQL